MEFVIVLGSSDPVIRKNRVDRAIKYVNSINPPSYYDIPDEERVRLVFSGKGGGSPSEAEKMLQYATTLGVDPDNCIVEDKSMTTMENIDFTISKLRSLGWFKPTFIRAYTFTVCTSKFHAPRARLISIFKLSSLGDVKVIYDEDEGSKQRQVLESRLLIQCAKSLI